MLLAEVVAVSEHVASTRARSVKVAALAELFRRLAPDERVAGVAFATGEPRQGKVGVGWATIMGVAVPPAPEPTLTVLDVDAAIDRLGELSGTGSQGARHAALRDLMARATAPEADFVRRLLRGELRQGALEGVVTDAVARAAGLPLATVRRAVMLAGDLPRVAAMSLGGDALAGVGLEVLRPVQPMLAATSADVGAAISDLGQCSVEWKLDGARVQAHRLDDEVRLYTRNLNDVTARLPEVVAVVRSLPTRSVVLDGEMIGMGGDDRPGPFQDTMSRFGRRDGRSGGLTVAFFDVLHADGVDLLDEPLVTRIEALERVAAPWRVPSVLTADGETAEAFLAASLAAGHEGVMVKGASSPYEAGRRGQAWRKVKPVHTFDLVVLAVEAGSGRRRGWLSNLHLGARNPAGGFVMVGKTFKGLTDELLVWQTARLRQLAVAEYGHIVEVAPELVVEVAIDGVQGSTRYPGGVALRFARVRRYREDKDPSEADTIASLQALLRP